MKTEMERKGKNGLKTAHKSTTTTTTIEATHRS